MIRVAKLSSDEMVVLTRHIRDKATLPSIRERAQAIILAANSTKTDVIAVSFGRQPRAVRGWLTDWNTYKFASLFTGYIDNQNAAKLSKEQKLEIALILQNSPSEQALPKAFWDIPSLKKYIKAEFQIAYESKESYRAILKYADLSFKYPDTFDRHRDEDQVRLRIWEITEEIKKLRANGYSIFCADEVRIEQETEIRRAWLKKGQRTIVKINRQKESQSYLGFLDQEQFRCFVYKLDWQNSEEILKAMGRFLSYFPDQKIAIIWDNASWHRSKKLKAELRTGGILERVHLIAMPPYAPDENPIEHVWNTAKKHTANIQDDTFIETKTRFENFVRNKTFKYSFRGINRQHFQ